MISKRLAPLVLSIGAIGCSSVGARPYETTLCEVVANAPKFNHTTIQFSASIESDGIEHTTLTSSSCSGKGVALSISDEVAKQHEVQQILDAIYRQGTIGTRDKSITATVTGTFVSTLNKFPSRTLILKSASDVHVSLSKAKN